MSMRDDSEEPVFKRRKPEGSEGSDHDTLVTDAEDEAPERESAAAASAPRPAPGGAAPLWVPAKPSDGGLGVPPFRPAGVKEPDPMNRPPATPLPTSAPVPPPAPLRPPSPPATFARNPRDLSDRRTLVVGRGISLQGTVQDAERLVVEGTVEASTIQASELSISHGGLFKGEIEVEDAEIAGTIDGTLIARASLVIRNTGRVLGTARCRRLQVEDGGQISGRVEMITDPVPRSMEAPRLAEPVG
jgi:cytoskeletal protein CcmA (bactofilin family)